MEYLVGLALCLAVGGLAVAIGFDRDRAFYPTVLIVIATYYVLFAAMGASARALIMEVVAASGLSALALIGFKKNLWLVAAAILAHKGCYSSSLILPLVLFLTFTLETAPEWQRLCVP